jgi:Glycosyl transferase family 11
MKQEKLNEVTVEVIGGLGNQLFCFFAGLHIARKRDATLVADLSQIGSGGTFHGFEILKLNLPQAEYKSSRIQYSFLSNLLKRIDGKLFRTFPIYQQKRNQFSKRFIAPELGYVDLSNVPSNKKIFSGYFQSWRYFDSIIKLERINVDLINPSEEYLHYEEIFKSQLPIILHVRRGDYKNLSDDFGLLSKKYYLDAIDNIPSQLKLKPKWVFSDDIELCKVMFSDIEMNYVDSKALTGPAEEMMLMTHASVNIIANSTFSWWGAMLNKCNSVVIAPDKWFKEREDPNDLIPPRWTRIKSQWE